MRKLILAAAGLALLVPAGLSQLASAQTAPAAGAPAAQPAPAGQPGGPGQPGAVGQAGGPGPVAGLGGPAVPPPPPPPGGPGMAPPPPPPPPPSPAAHVHLQRGDAVVDVKCHDGDSTKTCADVANAMLDRLANQPSAARN